MARADTGPVSQSASESVNQSKAAFRLVSKQIVCLSVIYSSKKISQSVSQKGRKKINELVIASNKVCSTKDSNVSKCFTILYCTILYYTILHYTILCGT